MKHVRIPDFSQPVPVRATSSARRQLPVDRRYRNLPDETQPGTIEPWQAVAPVRPDTAHNRSLRFLDVAGELLAAFAIIGGGMVLTGFPARVRQPPALRPSASRLVDRKPAAAKAPQRAAGSFQPRADPGTVRFHAA